MQANISHLFAVAGTQQELYIYTTDQIWGINQFLKLLLIFYNTLTPPSSVEGAAVKETGLLNTIKVCIIMQIKQNDIKQWRIKTFHIHLNFA